MDGSVEVISGVRLFPAPGHSPGQLAVELGDEALYLADVVADELHVQHPEWVMAFEPDAELVVATRRALLARAAEEGRTVAAAHVTPARVRRSGDRFRLEPLESAQ